MASSGAGKPVYVPRPSGHQRPKCIEVPQSSHGSHGTSTSRDRSPSPAGRNVQSAMIQNPPGHVFPNGSQQDNYPTIADRLLALRASQESSSSGERSARYGSAGPQTTRPPVNTNPQPGQRQGHTDTETVNTRTVQINRDRDRDKPQSARRPDDTPKAKRHPAKRAIKVFTAVLYLVGIPMLVIGIVLICVPNRTDIVYDAGLVLVILASLMTVAAIVFSILLRLGVCAQSTTQSTTDVQRASHGIPNTKAQIIKQEPSYYPQPAPGYHTPLPFGPTLPGYIPPQVVYSKYANKAFNHRAAIAGTDTPLSEEGEDALPQGFPSYTMKGQRQASGNHGNPSEQDLLPNSPGEGPSNRQTGTYVDHRL